MPPAESHGCARLRGHGPGSRTASGGVGPGSEGVRLTRSDTLSDEAAACIAEVVDHSKSRIERGGDRAHPEHVEILDRHVKVKLHDKLGALNLLAKHLGLLKEPEAAQDRPLFPRGFFEALITRDPSKLGRLEARAPAVRFGTFRL